MQVSILGPVEVWRDGVLVPVSGGRVRALLTRLALGYGRPVGSAELVDAIWFDAPPSDAANALQSLVSRLRRALGAAGAVVPAPGGYRLDVRPDDVDASTFSAAVRAGRAQLQAGRAADAAETLRGALALWRGMPLADLDPPPPAAGELTELRLGALGDRLDADLRCGRAADVVAEAEALAAGHPLRERFTLLLMDALSRTGRTAEALTAYEERRRYLAETLGTDPSPELRAAHLQLLRGQPSAEPARSRHRTNLRAQLTSFLGRTDEAKRIGSLLDVGRLVTIVGPGGAGKTRLAGVVAHDRLEQMDDGVWLIELAPVTDPEELPQAFLGALGMRSNNFIERSQERAVLTTGQRLLDLLADAECLLVVDNCEHVVTAVAELIEELLVRCPSLRVLATSREPLGIDGESLCLLPPLLLPPADATADDVLSWPSVALFADRAAAVSAGFDITDESVHAVVEIVRRLDGLPLAIELAAARLRVMPVAEIATRLSDRFRLLTGGSRTAMPRHRTLRAVVEWSWELLTPAEQQLAERLAIFPSGATLDSATAICAGELLSRPDIADVLNALVEKSLLQIEDGAGLRYRMLETIREYGIERLAERGEIESIRTAHAHYFAALVHEADGWIRRAEQVPWLRRLEAERDNILAALRHLGESGDAAATVDLALELGVYWTLIGFHSEAAIWLRFALTVEGPSDERHRLMIEGLLGLNALATTFGDGSVDEVEIGLSELDVLGERLDAADDSGEPLLTMLRPMLAFFRDDMQHVLRLMERAITVEDDWTRATIYMFRANLFENEGNVERMRQDTEVALELFTRIGDRWGLASTLSALGQLYTLDGRLDDAIEAYARAARYLVEFGATEDEAFIHLRLADLSLRRGDIPAARREAALVRSAEVQAGSRTHRMMADTMEATIARLVGDSAAMRRYRDQLAEQLPNLGAVHPLTGHIRAMALTCLSMLHLELGDPGAAHASLLSAHASGIGTKDMPIVAAVVGATAAFAFTAGQPADAAELLGIAASVRGSADDTALDTAALTEALRSALGSEFETYYRRGLGQDRESGLRRADPARLVPSSGSAD